MFHVKHPALLRSSERGVDATQATASRLVPKRLVAAGGVVVARGRRRELVAAWSSSRGRRRVVVVAWSSSRGRWAWSSRVVVARGCRAWLSRVVVARVRRAGSSRGFVARVRRAGPPFIGVVG